MGLTAEDLQNAKEALKEEDQRMIERCVYNLCGQKCGVGKNGNAYRRYQSHAASANIKNFGETSALELLSKLGQYFLKTGYGSGE